MTVDGSGGPGSAGRSRRARGVGRRSALDGGAFQLAHARVEVDVQVALAFLRLFEFVGQHFDLAADLGDVALQSFDVVGEVDQRAAFELPLEL